MGQDDQINVRSKSSGATANDLANQLDEEQKLKLQSSISESVDSRSLPVISSSLKRDEISTLSEKAQVQDGLDSPALHDNRKASSNASINNASSESDEPSSSNFPQKLMEILSSADNEDIISWLPHGKGFLIRDKKRFASEVLPKYFSKQSKFTSFTRKLNRWSFTRVTRGPETGAYYHPLFQRDVPGMCMQMSCINAKSPQQLQPMNPIALGLGMPNNFVMPWTAHTPPGVVATLPMSFDPTDPTMVMSEEQRDKFQQHFQQQQQYFMTMMSVMNKQQQEQPIIDGSMSIKSESVNFDTNVKSENDQKENESVPIASLPAVGQQPFDMNAAFAAFQQQQRQYYMSMVMAQQQQFTMMAAGMNTDSNEPALTLLTPLSTSNSAPNVATAEIEVETLVPKDENAYDTAAIIKAEAESLHEFEASDNLGTNITEVKASDALDLLCPSDSGATDDLDAVVNDSFGLSNAVNVKKDEDLSFTCHSTIIAPHTEESQTSIVTQEQKLNGISSNVSC